MTYKVNRELTYSYTHYIINNVTPMLRDQNRFIGRNAIFRIAFEFTQRQNKHIRILAKFSIFQV